MLFHVSKQSAEIQVIHLNEQIQAQRKQLKHHLGKAEGLAKLFTFSEKKEKKNSKLSDERVFVLDFKGDMHASAVAHLREEITLILATAQAGKDKVVIRLESAGGLVHEYGLAATQLLRLREAGFEVTICVDKVAASGGYMMACIAHQVVAAPFAVLGSIGVVAQIPNFNRFLKRHRIDFEQFTAGEYKRTVTMFGENSDEAKAKFSEELHQTHQLFKHFVEKYRPQLDIAQVATGEHWYGQDALKLNLVDQLATSDDYLLNLVQQHQVYVLHSYTKPTLGEKLGLHSVQMLEQIVPSVVKQATHYLHQFNILNK